MTLFLTLRQIEIRPMRCTRVCTAFYYDKWWRLTAMMSHVITCEIRESDKEKDERWHILPIHSGTPQKAMLDRDPNYENSSSVIT